MFHEAYNYCRDNYDTRLLDDFSEGRWNKIMTNLLREVKNGASDDELYNTVLNGFELLSPNGSPRMKFEQAAQRIADSFNKLKGEEFEEARRLVIADRFNVNNIEGSIRHWKVSREE